MRIAVTVAVLAFSLNATQDAPSADEQAAIIQHMRTYADAYRSSLPDFICLQQTTHFESGYRREHWHKGDIVLAQLSSVNGQEHQQIEQINNRPVTFRVPQWRWHLTTEGEFGADLTQMFAPGSDTHFEWNRWTTVAGRRLAVFGFSIDQQHSTKKLTRMGVSAIIPYRGEVWGDPQTGEVWHVMHDSVDIPAELDTAEIQTTVDYDFFDIAGTRYLLPAHAVILQKTSSRMVKNEIGFSQYRKFQAQSSVTFGPEQ